MSRSESEPATEPTVTLTARQVRWIRAGAFFSSLMIVCLSAGLFYTVPRSIALTKVLDENLQLKERLDDIDARMSEVDRLLLRLRLYDSQLRSLTPAGDHGPVDLSAVDASNEGPMGEVLASEVDGPSEDSGPGMRDLTDWVSSLEERVIATQTRLVRLEPGLSELVVELEDLRSLDAALPKRWPTSGALTSGYGWRRNPVGVRGFKFHSGLDIANEIGTPVFSTADGVVVKAEFNSGYGRQIILDHGYGIATTYSHLDALLVREGQRVVSGMRIGLMGNTGKSTGPHLHYEVHLDGHAVDPMDYVPRAGKKKKKAQQP